MKKICQTIILMLLAVTLSGCGNEYKGYWCNYEETSTIVVLLKEKYKDSDKEKIEAKIETFENVESMAFYTKEDYAAQLGENPDNLDIYDTYVIHFDSVDSIGTYIEELETLRGVASAEQSNAKTNISIYNIKSWGKYTYTNSDEATDADLETGKYKMKKGVITFTPEDDEAEEKLLYTKDGHLCGNADCSIIYARSNKTCSAE